MTARARRHNESFKKYRASLKSEERWLRARLRGRNWRVRSPRKERFYGGVRQRGCDGTMYTPGGR